MRRWFQEVWNEGKTDTIHELLGPDAIAIGQLEDGKELRAAGDFVTFVKNLRDAFPDMKIKVEDVFGSEDRVALRWSSTMTHNGNQLRMPPPAKWCESRELPSLASATEKSLLVGTIGIS
jgi:predicted ester cyclase